jgi:hypothetical protein
MFFRKKASEAPSFPEKEYQGIPGMQKLAIIHV